MNARNQLLESLYPQIINHYASMKNISLEESKDIFFSSKTYALLISDNDLYTKGIDYITNELEREHLVFK